MSKIYDFNYVEKVQLEDRYRVYMFLDIVSEQYWLNCFLNSNKYRVNITNKIEAICKRLYQMNIQDWNLKDFTQPMHYTPSLEWKLIIHTDSINVNCLGTDNFPLNWNEFIDILEYIVKGV